MRLIDADALQNILLTIAIALKHEYGSLGGAVSGCMKHIDNAPTVDAVPVVRCRECKYRGTDDCIFHIKGEPADEELLLKLDNDFCSYGERKGCVD